MLKSTRSQRCLTAGPITIEPLERRQHFAATTPPELLVDANPGAGDSGLSYCGQWEGKAVFATNVGGGMDGTTTLWTSDGTPAGTTRIGSIVGSIRPGEAVVANGNVYFIPTNESQFGGGIGWMNLQSGSVTKYARFWTLSNPYTPGSIHEVDGDVRYRIFYRWDRGSGWRVVSLSRGLVSAADIDSEGFTTNGRGLTITTPTRFPSDPQTPTSLYQRDHSRDDLSPYLLKSDVPRQNFVRVHEGLALFAANDHEVWATDGTLAGTRKIAETETMAGVSLFGFSGGNVLYARQTPETGLEVWSQPLALDTTPPPAAPGAPRLAPGMDTGASATDDITRNAQPMIIGTAAPGALVTLFANGDEVGTAIAGDDGSYSITPNISLDFSTSTASFGQGPVRLRVNATSADATISAGSAPLDLVIDQTAPIVGNLYYSNYYFNYQVGVGATGFNLVLGDALAIDQATVNAGDFVLQNVTTGQLFDASRIELTMEQSKEHEHPYITINGTYSGLPSGELPGGAYRLTIAAGAIADLAGNGLAAPIVRDFTIGTPAGSPAPFLSNGLLWISGSDSSDDVIVTRSASKRDRLTVMINGFRSAFNVSDVRLIRSELGAGDDSFIVRELAGTIPFGVSVLGGDGNDTILTGSGDDTLYGQAGQDLLHGSAGRDRLWGGDDADRLFGGDGPDIVYGQSGLDVFSRRDLLTELRDRQPDEPLVLV